eukprot:364915-Chlamydomonas_euryale.AAC.16
MLAENGTDGGAGGAACSEPTGPQLRSSVVLLLYRHAGLQMHACVASRAMGFACQSWCLRFRWMALLNAAVT